MDSPVQALSVAPEAPATAAQWTDPVVLTGRFIRLEPLTIQHAAGIFQHADADTVALLSRGGPAEQSVQGWAEYIGRLNAVPGRVNWAVVVVGGQQGGAREVAGQQVAGQLVAGRVSYSTVQPADRWAEIGTMLTPPFQGGFCNPEAKLLLMERAFTVLGAGRVHFKVDARNARSRAAMRKLGATEEGTLRRYQVRPDGTARDSVMFSVLTEEWPAVRAGLLARLDSFTR
ncbi:GNAT family N-acetyltransferase [Deinococcus altitudinis]|uniref:GNAT family N-acetyltransferase n=1 Tax=Deinococcus altitudinis TaxID=468914 RepID=UPI003891DF14